MKEVKNKLSVSYEYFKEDDVNEKLNGIFDWLFSKMTNYLVTVSGVVTVSGTNFVTNNYPESQS